MRPRNALRCARWETVLPELVFGPETRGLPGGLLAACPEGRRLRIPMRTGARSLNLSNAVAVTVFEAWRQNGFGAPAVA